jgi:hypothetical protein
LRYKFRIRCFYNVLVVDAMKSHTEYLNIYNIQKKSIIWQLIDKYVISVEPARCGVKRV